MNFEEVLLDDIEGHEDDDVDKPPSPRVAVEDLPPLGQDSAESPAEDAMAGDTTVPVPEPSPPALTPREPANIKNASAHLKYISELLSCRCAPDLMRLHIYPNAKEVSESFALYNACRRHLASRFDTKDPSVVCIVVGDGVSPRTGALMCFRTAWKVHSIDPALRVTPEYKKVRNLTLHSEKVEDVVIDVPSGRAVILCMHTHVTLECAVSSLRLPNGCDKAAVGVVSCPCCQFQQIHTRVFGVTPDATYEDDGIVSAQRKMYVWRGVEGAMAKAVAEPGFRQQLMDRESISRRPRTKIMRRLRKREQQAAAGIDWRSLKAKRLANLAAQRKGASAVATGSSSRSLMHPLLVATSLFLVGFVCGRRLGA